MVRLVEAEMPLRQVARQFSVNRTTLRRMIRKERRVDKVTHWFASVSHDVFSTEPTGFEPAISTVTVWHVDHYTTAPGGLRYEPAMRLFVTRSIIPDMGHPVKHFGVPKINWFPRRFWVERGARLPRSRIVTSV